MLKEERGTKSTHDAMGAACITGRAPVFVFVFMVALHVL